MKIAQFPCKKKKKNNASSYIEIDKDSRANNTPTQHRAKAQMKKIEFELFNHLVNITVQCFATYL